MSLVLAGSLLAAAAGADRLPTADTRAGIVAGYRLVLSTNDLDGDGRLSRSEWEAMVSRTWPASPREVPPPDNYDQARSAVLAMYADYDRDHDDYLTLSELVREPLAQFACMDRNRDGRISRREVWRAMSRCASQPMRIGFISEPPAAATRR